MCLAIPGKIISFDPPTVEKTLSQSHDKSQSLTALVDFSGVQQRVRMDFLPDAKVDDYILVHVGVGLSLIDQEEAQETLELMKELGVCE